MAQTNSVSTASSPQELDIKSILLLDDDEQLAEALKALLEAHNFVVTLARNGVEGVREVIAMDFDVILCDFVMPGLTGDLLYSAVRLFKPHLCNRFIFMSGETNDKKLVEFAASTGRPIFWKPFVLLDLLEGIEAVVRMKIRTQEEVAHN